MVNIGHDYHKNASLHCSHYTCLRGLSTVKLHLSGLIGTANHPDMQKISKIEFFFEKYATLAVSSSAVTIYNMYLH
jgi:hypothetical protein